MTQSESRIHQNRSLLIQRLASQAMHNRAFLSGVFGLHFFLPLYYLCLIVLSAVSTHIFTGPPYLRCKYLATISMFDVFILDYPLGYGSCTVRVANFFFHFICFSCHFLFWFFDSRIPSSWFIGCGKGGGLYQVWQGVGCVYLCLEGGTSTVSGRVLGFEGWETFELPGVMARANTRSAPTCTCGISRDSDKRIGGRLKKVLPLWRIPRYDY